MVRIVKKPDERRLEIIEAAQDLFRSKQYENTTIQDVMDKLGIAKGTIYHYFQSKEELLEAVIIKMVEDDIRQKREFLQSLEGTSLVKVRALLLAGSIAARHKEALAGLHQPSNMGMHARLLAVTILQLAPLYAELIRQGCEEGIFRTDHPLECAEFLLTAVQFLTDSGFFPWAQEDLLRRALAFPKLIEAQLNAPAGSFQFLLNQFNFPGEE